MIKNKDSLKVADLVPNKTYTIVTADWTSPFGDVIRGEDKVRTFIAATKIGDIDFIEVARPNGSRHLISTNNIVYIQENA